MTNKVYLQRTSNTSSRYSPSEFEITPQRSFFLDKQSYNIRIFMFVTLICLTIIIAISIVYLSSPKSSKKCVLDFKRTMKSSLSSSSQPRSVSTGDFNNDKHIDIVVASSGTHNIGIFISKGDGTFVEQQIYSTGFQSCPYSVVVGHFNNDNYLDIAVANYGTNNIGIFLGNGNGTFNNQKVFSLGSSHPLFITIGDFNNDNQTDLVVINYGTNSINILLGNGNGSFQQQIIYSTGYDSIPSSVIVGDFNNDNQLDIGVANSGTNNIWIVLGYGNGSFANQMIYTTNLNSKPSSIAVGDINNDTHLDIIVANYGTGNIGLFLGYGNGIFAPQIIFLISTNSHPQYITLGDFDQDNRLDVVVIDSDNDQIHILLQYQHQTFGMITTYDALSNSQPFYAAIADFNNDNQSDIVVTTYSTNHILILTGYSMKPSVRQKNYFVGINSRPTSVIVYDLNNDNQLDLIVNNYDNDSILILNGFNNDETLMQRSIYSTGIKSAPKYLCIGDLNNDNRMDIITANHGSDSIGVFLANDNYTYGNVVTYFIGTGSKPWVVAVGYFNNDNWLDIVTANYGSGGINILIGDGNGTFGNASTYFAKAIGSLTTVAVGDVNNDNRLDIVTAPFISQKVVILVGHGNGSFTISLEYFLGNNVVPSYITLFDLNKDNRLDIIVASIQGNHICVLLGSGDGTFQNILHYPTAVSSSLYTISIADLNHDNRYDFVVTNIANDEVIIFYGYGNGTFHLGRTYSTGFSSAPYGIITKKLNNNNQTNIIVTLWGTGNVGILTEYDAATFANILAYSTGAALQPYSVTIADFNNDSHEDIAVINSGTDNLDILFGLDNKTFKKRMTYSIGIDSHPQYLITGDVNKDNYLDIITVNSKNDSISIFMGSINGSFSSQKMYSTGYQSYPFAVVMDDLNNDNRSDFVIANLGTNNIGILHGYEYSTFKSQSKTYSKPDTLGPWSTVVADFNNDSYMDIAVGFTKSHHICVLLGYGNGSFGDMIIHSLKNDSDLSSLAVSDFNNDGRLDIVVSIRPMGNIIILFGFGNGSFETGKIAHSIGDGSSPQDIVIGDINKDGHLDIVTANSEFNTVSILFGSSNGNFTTMKSYSIANGSYIVAVAIGDFNNDNRLDIVTANYHASNISVFLSSENGNFENPITYSTGYQSLPFSVIIDDFNKDTQLDIVTSNFLGNNIGIFLGYGNGSFASMVTYSTGIGSAPKHIDAGDFNNDNILDIAVANYGTNNIVVLFGIGDGSFLLGTAYSTGTGSGPHALAIGHFNDDTRLDIIVTNFLSHDIQVFLGDEIQPFAGVTTYSTGDKSKPHLIAVNHLNNDHWLDIVVPNYGTDNVGILFGCGHGIFNPIKTYPTGIGSAPYAVAIGDFNNDNYLDIVVTNSETNNIAILLGYNNETFEIYARYSTGTRSRPYTIALSDFNNDKILDIAIANSGTSNIFILYGYGNGTFGKGISYPLGYGYLPYSIAVKDLNQDGWMDIVIACYGTEHIETLIKMC